jgi:hypothetical protein
MGIDKKVKKYLLSIMGREPDYSCSDSEWFFYFEEELQYNYFEDHWYDIRFNYELKKLEFLNHAYDEWHEYHSPDSHEMNKAYIDYMNYKIEEALGI